MSPMCLQRIPLYYELEQQSLIRTLKIGQTSLMIVEATAAVQCVHQMIDQGWFFSAMREGR